MRRFLTVFACATAVSAEPGMVGASKCTWGPSYWCTSLSESNECQSHDYCMEKQWTQPVKQDQMCELCMKVAEAAVKQLKNNEEAIHMGLQELCNYCTTPDKCVATVDQNWASIKKMIEEDVTSGAICSAMNLCQQATETPSASQLKALPDLEFLLPLSPPNILPISDKIKFEPKKCSDLCQHCHNFGHDVKALANHEDRLEQLTDVLDQLCDNFPLKSFCRLVLSKKLVKKELLGLNVDKACMDEGFCTKEDKPVVLKEYHSCDDCQTLMSDIKAIAENDKDRFVEVIEQSCNLIPHPVNNLCKDVAKELAQKAEAALSDLQGEFACTQIAMCPDMENSSEQIKEDKFNKLFFSPGLEKEEEPEELENVSGKVCDYCGMAVQYIQYTIDSDITTDQIKQELEVLCLQLPSHPLQASCRAWIEKNYELLIDDLDLILNNPDQVCTKLHMCPAKPPKIQMVGAEKCTYGPSYWCSSKDTATECDAHEYCTQNVWQQQGYVNILNIQNNNFINNGIVLAGQKEKDEEK